MSTPMTKEAAARIQSATAKANAGIVPKDSFAAKAMSVATRSAEPQSQQVTQPNWPSKVPNKDSGKNRTNNPPKR